MRSVRFAVVATAVLVLAACSGGGGSPEAAQQQRARTRHGATTSSSSSTSSTTATTATTKPFTGMKPGDSGPRVTDLQNRLAAMHYDVHPNGSYDAATMQAVMAFQKVNGLGRDGVAGDETLGKLAAPVVPGPLVPGGGATRVEVDVARQVLFFYQGNALYRIVAVSTGSGERFCVDGRCATAVTPAGSFRVGSKVGGWQTGELGRLYKPSYFNGNIAIHGALSVPGGPASHGCVRVPMSSADWIYASLTRGTPVYVLNGPHVPAPFAAGNTGAPPATAPTTRATAPPPPPPPPPPSSTTTTSTTTSTTTTTTPTLPGP